MRPLAGLLGTLWLAGCAAADFDRPGAQADQAQYASLYPFYAELCAVSQIRKKAGFGPFIVGGVGGHSVLYLQGACRVQDAHYPTLKLCGAGEEPGVGLSVNAHYRNANWVATPGYDFFFHGTLRPGDAVTPDSYRQTQAQARALGIMDGVVFHDEVFDDMPEGGDRQAFKYEMSIATDYGIDLGRGRYCAMVPLTRPQMAKMVAFLNAQNAIYRDGSKDYEWNVLEDNCSHLTHNALAAAGVWDDWPVNSFILFAALNFPVPKNEFVNVMRRANDIPLADLPALFGEDRIRQTLLSDDWLVDQPGVIAESEGVRRPNRVYDTDVALVFYDDPPIGSYQRHFDRIVSEPRYRDLRANLQYFDALYRQVQADRKPIAWWVARYPLLATSPHDFAGFYRHFYTYVDAQTARVHSALASLEPNAEPLGGGHRIEHALEGEYRQARP